MTRQGLILFLVGYLVGVVLTKISLYLRPWQPPLMSVCDKCHRIIRVKPIIRTFHICGGL